MYIESLHTLDLLYLILVLGLLLKQKSVVWKQKTERLLGVRPMVIVWRR